MDRSDRLFVLFIIVAVLGAIFLAMGRARIERANRTVELILDADDVRTLSLAAGLPFSDTLAQLRRAGATSLAVREMTLADLTTAGYVLPMAVPGGSALTCPDPNLLRVIAGGIAAKLPRAEIGVALADQPLVVLRKLEVDQLASVPLLLRPDDIQAARAAGLRVVARLRNFPAATPEAIAAATAEAEAAGSHLIIFGEDQVLGFPDLVSQTAAAFTREDLRYGYVEMVSQKGDDALARLMVSHLIRVHSITDADMLNMSPAIAILRYERAVEERNVRACYVRLLLRPLPDAMAENTSYLQGLVTALRDGGFRVGPPVPLTAPEGWPPKWARALCLLGLPAALVLLLRRLVPLAPLWAWLVFLASAAAGTGLALLQPSLAAALAGLFAACAFPALAVTWVLQRSRATRPHVSAAAAIGRPLVGLVLASAVTLVGSALVVGIYSPVAYLQGVGRFAGVKLSYLAPLFVVLVAVIADLPGRAEPLAHWWGRVKVRTSQLLARPITLVEAVVVLLALGALAFAISRSGNQPALAPSPLELKFRQLLETILAVRPRTKEFLLGHPALMLAIALSLRGRRSWLPLVALLGGIGQVSLLNTYCHFHTPLSVGLLRTANGLWLGSLLGIILILLWRALFDRPPRAASP